MSMVEFEAGMVVEYTGLLAARMILVELRDDGVWLAMDPATGQKCLAGTDEWLRGHARARTPRPAPKPGQMWRKGDTIVGIRQIGEGLCASGQYSWDESIHGSAVEVASWLLDNGYEHVVKDEVCGIDGKILGHTKEIWQAQPEPAVEVHEGMRIRRLDGICATLRSERHGLVPCWDDGYVGRAREASEVEAVIRIGGWTIIDPAPSVAVDSPHARLTREVATTPAETFQPTTIGELLRREAATRAIQAENSLCTASGDNLDRIAQLFGVRRPTARERSRRAIDAKAATLTGRYAPAIVAVLRNCAEKWDLTTDEIDGAVAACLAWENERPAFARPWTEREKHAVIKAAGAAWFKACNRETKFMELLESTYERVRSTC